VRRFRQIPRTIRSRSKLKRFVTSLKVVLSIEHALISFKPAAPGPHFFAQHPPHLAQAAQPFDRQAILDPDTAIMMEDDVERKGAWLPEEVRGKKGRRDVPSIHAFRKKNARPLFEPIDPLPPNTNAGHASYAAGGAVGAAAVVERGRFGARPLRQVLQAPVRFLSCRSVCGRAP
jgi:hypothetical protein